jgi:hypothetical protein
MTSAPSYDQIVHSTPRSTSLGVHDVLDESRISSKSVYEVQGESAPLAAALALDKPNFFSTQMIRLYPVCLIAYLSTLL